MDIGQSASFAAARPAQPTNLCGACPGDCVDACFNDAIVRADQCIRIDEANCAGCGACLPACNLGHIDLEHGVARLIVRE